METTKPVKKNNNLEGDGTNRYAHPAFGTITVSRVSGQATLFQSELKHQHYIQLCIGRAELERGMGRDWVFGNRSNIVEVNMSEAQWASMVSSIGMGAGTPCTIDWAPDEGTPIKKMPYIDPLNKVDMASEEAEKRVDDQIERADNVLSQLDEILAGKTIKKTDLKNLRGSIASILNGAKSNLEFSKEQFTEHMENTISAAKSEIEGHVLNLAQQHGLERLKKETKLIEN